MRFSKFLVEMNQVIPAQQSSENPIVNSEINSQLSVELDGIITSPNLGIQKIRKVLFRYGLDLPAIYEVLEEGDEFAIELDGELFLYVLYYLTDEGNYDFYAEVTDWNGVDELMSDEEDLEEE
jgi:hypothetical protein